MGVKKILDESYNHRKELIYLKHNVVNIKKVKDYQEDLFGLKEYLPVLLQGFLEGYYRRMDEYSVLDDIREYMVKHKIKQYSREEETVEFVDWVGSHQDFKELLNKKEVKKLNDELKDLDEEINKLRKKYL